MAERTFDLIVVGGGTGRDIVLAAEAQGWRVALVERGPLGGTCHNRGCMPSKMLIHSSDVAEIARTGPRFGVQISVGAVDFSTMVRNVFGELDAERLEREQALDASDLVTFYRTEGRFVAPKTMAVGEDVISAPRVVIAAGTRPALPPTPSLDGVPYLTSDEALHLDELPRRLAIIGGGYIATELAHLFGELGTDVTLIVRGDRLLAREDREISEWFTRDFSQRHRVLLRSVAGSVSRNADGVEVVLQDSGERVVADRLLMATGRRPNSDLLDLDRTGVETEPGGYIRTNERFETSVSGIWAFGDIIGRMELKHVAVRQARHLARGLFFDDWRPMEYGTIPNAVFSSPQVAAVGKTEQQLRAEHVPYKVGRHEFRHTGMGMAIKANGLVKVLAGPGDELLGVHIVGPDASVLIHEAVVAMHATGRLDAITGAVHAHPALSQVVEEACRSAERAGVEAAI